MADFTPLSTNFQDDVLASSNSKRKYRMINNSDGTVSFEDATVYSQKGSEFGAKEVNEEREAINQLNTDMGDAENDIKSVNNRIDDLMYQRAYGYNNNGGTKTFYIRYEFRAGDKGTIYVTCTRSGTVNGLRKYTIIRGSALAYSTIQQGSGGVGWNGETLLNEGGSQTTGTDACILALTNVQGYAVVEVFSTNMKITETYFA